MRPKNALQATSFSPQNHVIGPEFSLLSRYSFPVQIGEPYLPFLDQLRCLPAAEFGAKEHPFYVRSAPVRLVWGLRHRSAKELRFVPLLVVQYPFPWHKDHSPEAQPRGLHKLKGLLLLL